MGTNVRHATHLTLAIAIIVSAIWAAPLGAQEMPSYARPATSAAAATEIIHGRIASVNGAWRIVVADDRGYNDDVALAQGTIINPTGLTLAPGMTVTIRGYNAGSSFAAIEIDTDYNYNGPAPMAAYYGPDYWYPGYAYGYGPAFSLGFAGGIGTSILIEQPFFFAHHFHGRPIVIVPPATFARPTRHILATQPAAPVSEPASGYANRSMRQQLPAAPISRSAAAPPTPVTRSAPPPATRTDTSSSRRR